MNTSCYCCAQPLGPCLPAQRMHRLAAFYRLPIGHAGMSCTLLRSITAASTVQHALYADHFSACDLPPNCCFPSSIDYPVKWFVVVVGEQAASGKNAIAYEVKHLLQYPQDKVGESCCWCHAVLDLSWTLRLYCSGLLQTHSGRCCLAIEELCTSCSTACSN